MVLVMGIDMEGPITKAVSGVEQVGDMNMEMEKAIIGGVVEGLVGARTLSTQIGELVDTDQEEV